LGKSAKKERKFKIGDRVWLIPGNYFIIIDRILEDNIDSHDRLEYPYVCYGEPFNYREDELISEELYNSPLYKALTED
jgi:hypothetical protein